MWKNRLALAMGMALANYRWKSSNPGERAINTELIPTTVNPLSKENPMKLNPLAILVSVLALSCASVYAQAQPVDVKNAWVRTTVPGQKGTGVFMMITAKDGAKLVGGSSPVAGVTEIHEMKMEGDVMKMRALKDGLDLPAGKSVELKPGGYHVMLMDLKAALPKDSTIPLTLVFKDAKGTESRIELKVPVAAVNPSGKADTGMHKH